MCHFAPLKKWSAEQRAIPIRFNERCTIKLSGCSTYCGRKSVSFEKLMIMNSFGLEWQSRNNNAFWSIDSELMNIEKCMRVDKIV